MLINGKRADSLSAHDRGLAYGDGLFETIRVAGGRLVLFDEHMSRLRDGCNLLGIPAPLNEITADAHELLVDGRISDAVLKIIITRGEAGRGYRPDSAVEPNRIVGLHEYRANPNAWREGVATMICRTRLAMNPLFAGVKHLNRIEQVMAARELTEDFAEGLMMDTRGKIIEGTRTNLFVVEGGRPVTPDLGECGVKGTMRQFILDRIPSSIEPVSRSRLSAADEVFLCNSVVGVWPVISLSASARKNISWRAGRVTRSIQAMVESETGIAG